MPAQSKVLTNADLKPKPITDSKSRIWTNKDTEKYLPAGEDDFQPDDDFQTDSVVEDDFIPDTVESITENQPNEKHQGFLSSAWDAITTPLSNHASRFADSVANQVDKPSLERSPLRARIEGFGAGAIEGMGDLVDETTSPLGLATILGPKGFKPAVNLAGKATEGVGSIMRRYQPLTGMPIVSTFGGRTIRNIERGIGKGIEAFGNKMRGFGNNKVKVVDGKIAEIPEGSSLTKGSEITPESVVIDPKNAPKKLRERIKEIENLPDELVSPTKPSIQKKQSLDELLSELTEGQSIARSPKPKVRPNKDGTFTNLDTGEVFDSSGKPVSVPNLNQTRLNIDYAPNQNIDITKVSAKKVKELRDKNPGMTVKDALNYLSSKNVTPNSLDRNSQIFRKNQF